MVLDRVASPERLWLMSIALQRRRHRRLALFVKQLNALLYHNSLPINASVGSDVRLGHHSFGVVIHDNVEIGNGVRIWHHVTIAVRGHADAPAKIIIEDDVRIGANSVIITPFGKTLRIERAARIGAGVVVTQDVPAGATVVSPAPRILVNKSAKRLGLAPEPDASAPPSSRDEREYEEVAGEDQADYDSA
jgi:serine acetyltransferase